MHDEQALECLRSTLNSTSVCTTSSGLLLQGVEEVRVVRFTPEERVEIWDQLEAGQPVRSVAIGLGRYPSAGQLFVQGRGALRRELHKSLRTGRAVRHPADPVRSPVSATSATWR
jgi:hypothetical protein